MKPILMNTEMVRAILDGRKTVTRRVIHIPNCGYFMTEPPRVVSRYQTGDILYVRRYYLSLLAAISARAGCITTKRIMTLGLIAIETTAGIHPSTCPRRRRGYF